MKWYYIKGEERIQKGYLDLPYFPVEDQIKAANVSYLRFNFRAGKLLGVAIKFFSWNFFIRASSCCLHGEEGRNFD